MRPTSLLLRPEANSNIMLIVSEEGSCSQNRATAQGTPVISETSATRTVGRLWIWLGVAALLIGVLFGWVMSGLGS